MDTLNCEGGYKVLLQKCVQHDAAIAYAYDLSGSQKAFASPKLLCVSIFGSIHPGIDKILLHISSMDRLSDKQLY